MSSRAEREPPGKLAATGWVCPRFGILSGRQHRIICFLTRKCHNQSVVIERLILQER